MSDAAINNEQSNAEATELAAAAADQGGAAAGSEDDRKLFVGGLPQDIVESEIREYFAQFGELANIDQKTDQATGRSRGFAFIVYRDVAGLQKAVAVAEHVMKGKKVAVKKAEAKQGKIYVGKLPSELSDEEIKAHFEKHGTVVTVEQPFDKMKNERKNFCFITYEREDTAKKLLKEGSVFINQYELEIRRVTPKPNNDMGRGGGFGGFGARGGARGSWGAYGAGAWGASPYGGGDFQSAAGWGGGFGGPTDFYGGYSASYGTGYPSGYGAYAGGKAPRGMVGRGGARGARGGRGSVRPKPY